MPLARKTEFVQADQSDLPCPVALAKIFRFAPDPNQIYIANRPTEAPAMEPKRRGVPDTSHARGITTFGGYLAV
jgi:hypothetical protein